MDDAIGQLIMCRGDSVILLDNSSSSSSSSAAAVSKSNGNHHYGVLLGRRPGYKVVVRRLDGSEVTVNARDVRVVDRSFLCPGMYVASSTDRGGRLGYVTAASTELDLIRLVLPAHSGGDAAAAAAAPAVIVATGLSPAEVRRVQGFGAGDWVVMPAAAGAGAGSAWLGRVAEVCLDVDVRFDDGAVCRIARAQQAATAKQLWAIVDRDGSLFRRPESIEPLGNGMVFYPGKRVGGPPAFFRACRWLKGYWKPRHGKGTVSKVETTSVLVHWVASSSSSSQHLELEADAGSVSVLAGSSALANQQSPHDLTLFRYGNSIQFTYWGAGHPCFFHGSDVHGAADGASDDGDHSSQPTTRSRTQRRLWMGAKRPRRRAIASSSRTRPPLCAVASTRTTVDVLWQDGTRESGVPSVSVFVISDYDATGNELEFFPGQTVVRRRTATATAPALAAWPADLPEGTTTTTTTKGPGEDDEARVGFVRSYSYKDRTVRVSWFETATDGHGDETISAYDLTRVSNHYPANIFYGDIVVRRLQRPATDGSFTAGGTAAAGDLSWVGHVVRPVEGGDDIKVRWGDGSTSTVLCNEVAFVHEHSFGGFLHELGDWVEEDGDTDNTIDTAQDDVVVAVDNNTDEEDDDNSGSDSDDSSAGSSESDSEDDAGHASMRRLGRIRAIIQTVTGLADKVFAHGRRYLKGGLMEAEAPRSELAATEKKKNNNNSSNVSTPTPEPGTGDGDVKENSAAEAGINGGNNGDGGGDPNSREEKVDKAGATGDDEPFRFPQFEIMQMSPPDHHYLDEMTGPGGKKWTKRVQKEWKILENNLPDTIYVRAFEDRMDLLRAVMVGASGTPYHDGLFFFDLQLPPSSYPAEPPLVSYRSFGLSVNPNLSPSGTVCLSLLNTFGGQHEVELWSPEKSNVLQVVVSIQGLVLTALPYYNEPAWAKAGTPMGQRHELPYSENVFLVSLHTMLHLLRRPPVGFEELVRDHFRRRGQRVIRACEAYRDGFLVGTLDEEGRPTDLHSMERQRPCSAGFRLALLNVLPRLVEAFASIGAQGC